ncbi:hypothetical protein CCHR01_16973 [Colletotrichum chrysophilum]|uniref:Uncharacterized protein n=1 Tax=Colletotrichum chrysophilum TaxID=1836956 RepID=A0AAD9ECY9_9PEZI|nr:hypothetical protein CCHR01_16973 [Colletotrichum chrysophilum]
MLLMLMTQETWCSTPSHIYAVRQPDSPSRPRGRTGISRSRIHPKSTARRMQCRARAEESRSGRGIRATAATATATATQQHLHCCRARDGWQGRTPAGAVGGTTLETGNWRRSGGREARVGRVQQIWLGSATGGLDFCRPSLAARPRTRPLIGCLTRAHRRRLWSPPFFKASNILEIGLPTTEVGSQHHSHSFASHPGPPSARSLVLPIRTLVHDDSAHGASSDAEPNRRRSRPGS